MYMPAWGRFNQPDPIGYVGGRNLYAYVGNEPVSRRDPEGLCYDTVCAACRANPAGCALLAAELAGGTAVVNEAEAVLPEVEAAAGEASRLRQVQSARRE